MEWYWWCLIVLGIVPGWFVFLVGYGMIQFVKQYATMLGAQSFMQRMQQREDESKSQPARYHDGVHPLNRSPYPSDQPNPPPASGRYS